MSAQCLIRTVYFDFLNQKVAHWLLLAWKTFALILGFMCFSVRSVKEQKCTAGGQTDGQTGKTRNAAF